MSFDESQVVRSSDGKFQEKSGSVPEVQLGSSRPERIRPAVYLNGKLMWIGPVDSGMEKAMQEADRAYAVAPSVDVDVTGIGFTRDFDETGESFSFRYRPADPERDTKLLADSKTLEDHWAEVADGYRMNGVERGYLAAHIRTYDAHWVEYNSDAEIIADAFRPMVRESTRDFLLASGTPEAEAKYQSMRHAEERLAYFSAL